MLAFYREQGVQPRRGRGSNEDEDFFVTFCFADPIHADAFHKRFGGALLTFQGGAAPRLRTEGKAPIRTKSGLSTVSSCTRPPGLRGRSILQAMEAELRRAAFQVLPQWNSHRFRP
jgi:hypothetical protein